MKEDFKLPLSSYQEIVKIILAYNSLDKPASLKELKQTSGINPTIISGNNKFLTCIDVISGSNLKSITEDGKKLAKAIEHKMEEDILKYWREIIYKNDFIRKMISAVKIRNGMDEQGLQSHIRYSSGQKNDRYSKTGSATLIEILKIANIINEVDGKFIVINGEEYDQGNNEQNNKQTEDIKKEDFTQSSDVIPTRLGKLHSSKYLTNININIDLKIGLSDLEGAEEKIKHFIEKMQDDEDENS
jgi:hypothetical protein